MKRIFISYSHADEVFKDRLIKQLAALEHIASVEIWNDRKIAVGSDWLAEINEQLDLADVAILLVSSSFLASGFIKRKEIPPLISRHRQNSVWIIPVIIKPCAWQEIEWLSQIQARPKDGLPLSRLNENEAEEAMAGLTTEIAKHFRKKAIGAEEGSNDDNQDPEDELIKTTKILEAATNLPVLFKLGDLNKMTEYDLDSWSFRAWTAIAGQISGSPNHGMVCGIVSSEQGEGRSTWIKLLGNAASQRGLRVLTVGTKPSGSDEPAPEAVDNAMTEVKLEADADEIHTEMFSPNSLAFPAEITKKFIAGEMPSAHIPLPGWVWNLDRRRQWQMALAHWRAIDNLVLLVELPPAYYPESTLLAESLPNIIWLAERNRARVAETRAQIETLRHAKCKLVGAVLNRDYKTEKRPTRSGLNLFSRFFRK